MKEYIDQNKCTDFELYLLYIMCFLKEDDMNELMKTDGWMCLGEMDRYCRFGIDWSKFQHLQDLVTLEDNDDRWELENMVQDVALAAHKLYNYMKDRNLLNREGMTNDATRYQVTSTK